MSDRSELLDESGIPFITTILDVTPDRPIHPLYVRSIVQSLEMIIPGDFFSDHLAAGLSNKEISEELNKRIPLWISTKPSSAPGTFTVTVLSRMRHNAFRFFYEMVSRWLVPGQRLDVQFFNAFDFKMPAFGDQVYTLCDLMIGVRDQAELSEIQRNLPTLESELLIGMDDYYVAQRILDVRGLTSDEKTAAIQEHIARLRTKRKDVFDTDVFQEMQHFLVTCPDSFKEDRAYRHLGRIITVHYLFRKELRQSAIENPTRRHLLCKVLRAMLTTENPRKIVGLCIGVNFFHRHEVFEEAHILRAINHHVPGARLVEGSFMPDSARRERVRTIYLEVEMPSRSFTSSEIRLLQTHLTSDLKDCVEHLMHPIFMPRNEEETMRNILALAHQIKFVRDIPQVIVSFDEQTHTDLVFTVVVCRVLKDNDDSIQKLVKTHCSLTYHHDRSKNVGMVRKRYPKQATVFRVSLAKATFLRANHSLDLQAARQHVVQQLVLAIGGFRDYNGGMIAKQSEALDAVKQLVGEEVKAHEFALQNLFYSIEPPVMRNVLDPKAIQHLFQMSHDQKESLTLSEDKEHFYALLEAENSIIKKEVEKALSTLSIPATELACSSVEIHGKNAMGFIYRSEDRLMRKRLQTILESFVQPVLQRR